EVVEVRARDVPLLRDDDVAPAVRAERLAERHVDVDGQRTRRRSRLRERRLVVRRAEVVAPRRRGRVARVARTRDVVAGERFGRDAVEGGGVEGGWGRHAEDRTGTAWFIAVLEANRAQSGE